MRIFSICSAFLLLFATGVAAQQSSVRIDRPGVKVGDTWMYNTLNGWNAELDYVSVNSVKEIAKDGILMESTPLGMDSVSKVRRTLDFNLVSIDAPGFTQRALPYYPNYEFPLEVGKTWQRDVDLNSTKTPDKRVKARLEGKVVGWESVTVPAGTFRALKIVVSGWYRASNLDGSWGGRIEDVLWYAPEVRNAVRYEYRDTVETAPYSAEIHELVRYWLVP